MIIQTVPILHGIVDIQRGRNYLQSCNAPTCKTEGKGSFPMANKRGLESEHNLNEVNGKRSKIDVVEHESDNSQYDDTGDGQYAQDDQDDYDSANNVEDEDENGIHTLFLTFCFPYFLNDNRLIYFILSYICCR